MLPEKRVEWRKQDLNKIKSLVPEEEEVRKREGEI